MNPADNRLESLNSRINHLVNEHKPHRGKKCPKEFCKQFVEHPITQNKGKETTLRTIRNLTVDRQGLSIEQSDMANAINNAKPSMAIGPDSLSMIILKKLPTKPTSLQPMDLRLNPIATANFLGLPALWQQTNYTHNPNR